MALLYDRTEQDGVVVIVLRRLLLGYPLILALYVLALFVLRSPLVAVAFIVIGLVLIVRDRRAIAGEIREAAAAGKLTVSGSQWSLKNPKTYRIGEPVRRRKGRPRSKKRKR